MSEPVLDVAHVRWVDAEVLMVRPGDVLIFMCPGTMSRAVWEHLAEEVARIFPNNKALCMDDGLRVGVLRPETPGE